VILSDFAMILRAEWKSVEKSELMNENVGSKNEQVNWKLII